MTKTEKELKKEFSAYVKTAIKNTQKQYLIKKGKILDNEIAMDLCSLKELQQKVLMLRIVYVKSFDDIGGILNMTAKQAENSYYNAIRKIRKQMGDNFG